MIEQAAVRLLACREHSRAELWRKLHAKSYDEEMVEKVLDDLVRRSLLSDERFTEQYLSSRQKRGFGPLRIKGELRERGINNELISTYLNDQNECWIETLRQTHDKKFGIEPPDSLKEKARRVRFLEYRGFTGEQIRYLFQNI